MVVLIIKIYILSGQNHMVEGIYVILNHLNIAYVFNTFRGWFQSLA